MKEAIVTPQSERAPGALPQEPAAGLLSRLEQLIDTELGPLREGVEPLVDELRAGLAALYPSAGGRQLPPKEQEEQRAQLAQVLDTLEDVLEALQRAARARRHTGPGAGTRRH
ncbi:hypothetical protein ACN28E_25105 [Archangium lansingense]|uniref:hypothetical protein n=1 Tax=Archangium lansingense TaxID=2995310 RepID=UPI003B7C3F8C